MVIPAEPPSPVADAATLSDGFGLTQREPEVAALVAQGHDPSTVAARPGLRQTSARTYLKTIFHKTGTGRQAELAALLARLAP